MADLSQTTEKYTYPEDLHGNPAYDNYVVFVLKKWDVGDKAVKDNPRGSHKTTQNKAIALYIPHQVRQESSVTWNQEELGLGREVIKSIEGNQSWKELFTSDAWSSIKSNFKSAGDFTGLNVSGTANFWYGETKNPKLRMIFQNVENRSFNFEFEFAPKSETEVWNVINIMKSFEEGHLPKLSSNSMEYEYPDVFYITMKQKGQDGHFEPIRFKPCILPTINIDHTPEGVWSVFKNGFPVKVTMSLSFQEIVPRTKADVQNHDYLG